MELIIVIIIIISETGLLLAGIGRFSIPLLTVLSFILCAVIIKKRKLPPVFRRIPPDILPVLILAGFFFLRPYQYTDGGWDPGNYINTGAHIARTGSLVYHERYLKDTAALIRPDGTGIKHPGLFVKDASGGIVVPQFLYLFPVWTAAFFKMFGAAGAFYVNPLFALLSCLLLYLIVLKIFNRPAAFLAALFFAACPVQIWDARFPVSEISAQFLFLSGIYLWIRYLETEDTRLAFWSGWALGISMLAAVTSLIIVPPLIIYLILRRNKNDLFFLLPFFLSGAQLGIQLFNFSSIYIRSIMPFFSSKEIYIGIAGLALSVPAARRLKYCAMKPLAAGTALIFIWGFFIRPYAGGNTEAFNLPELGRYLSLPVLFTAAAGLILLLWREKKEGILFFSIMGLFSALFFIWDKKMISRYPFALRRYIPVVIPACCFWAACFFCTVTGRLKKSRTAALIILAAAVALTALVKNRHILGARDHYGWVSFWKGLSSCLAPQGIYLTSRYRWERPLKDILGENSWCPKDTESFALKLLKQGKEVYYLTDFSTPYTLQLDFEKIFTKSINYDFIEDSARYPPRVRKRKLNFSLFKVIPAEEADIFKQNEYILQIGEETAGLEQGFDRYRRFSSGPPGRWTMKKCRLVIPWFGDNKKQILSVTARGMPHKAGISMIDLRINKTEIVHNHPVSEKARTCRFVIPPGTVDTGNRKRAVLTIESNTWSPEEYDIKGYPPEIGIMLAEVKISLPSAPIQENGGSD